MPSETPDKNVPSGSNPRGTSSGPPPSEQTTGGPLSGKLGIFIFIVLFGTAGYLTWHTLTHPAPIKPDPPPVTYMCAQTLKTFQHKPTMGETIPVESPYTHRKTGYPTEECFWTKEGKRKLQPTYVLLNKYLGKKGPTLCPDCGKIVYPHNPPPPPETPLASQPAATTQPSKP